MTSRTSNVERRVHCGIDLHDEAVTDGQHYDGKEPALCEGKQHRLPDRPGDQSDAWAQVAKQVGGHGLWAAQIRTGDIVAGPCAAASNEFILSGYPHLEKAYTFGEGVIPILGERGLLAAPGTRIRKEV
jgi:alkanesulfonate monooxygenase SsuD/methylene tetrahydromethanopterin reductase-like flavin-dependent oxidoreductase (luciferase family)